MPDDPDIASAERFRVDIAEGTLAGWRWPNAGKPPLLFCHATGFCASAYKQMLYALGAGFDVFALDMRGHGRTDLPADPESLRSWDVYARDIAAFLDNQDRNGWTLAGHSMGGAAVALASCGRSDISALRLVEPVAPPRLFALAARTLLWPLYARRMPMAARAARRRARWASHAEAAAGYERKALFRDWAPGVLADYLEDGLVDEAGGARLACAPLWEAATFAAQAHDLWDAVRRAPAPLSVLAAQGPSTTVWPPARARLRRAGAALTLLDGVGHLAPMQDPARCARFIAGEGAIGATAY